ncbi:unnamed protein product [Rotaria sordida]|uniref:Uncharacterized protein n=1 Tax=Rotaria sordida TaxID=392033 RepID=A0A815GPU2_9BILA|nr:unnamed protein product [Rotaria sordida]CAF1427897.1 unnamed protein product [Rotaria sordida]CAF3859910.1 unnamed protein product [Rotaria sordida]CAF4041470.1 unnamed protein product [Rotaria sordida]
MNKLTTTTKYWECTLNEYSETIWLILYLFYFRLKRRKIDEINKVKKQNDDDIEEIESTVHETTTTNNSEANETYTTKRLSLLLEEMLKKKTRSIFKSNSNHNFTIEFFS